MPDFLHPGLLSIGLPLLALPILIHLINLMRHRPVHWAAMEFLLESQKKNSTWILLKQLLLLLLRILAVAAVVMIVAQPLLRNQLGRLLGGSKTHHIVLLDDSFSMADRTADSSAFQKGKDFVNQLVTQGARRAEPQTLTLVRYSRAGRLSRGRPPDFLEAVVNARLVAETDGKLKAMDPSQMSVGPVDALAALDNVLNPEAEEQRIIYLVSDFRVRDWDDSTAVAKKLTELNAAGAQVRLVSCVDAARGNLAITMLRALPGTRAAGVPLFMEIGVTNFGAEPARQVSVSLQEDGNPRAGEVIEEIPPGKTETRRFLVHFPTAGEHRVAASLQSDGVEADNTAFAVVDLPIGVPVLIVDGEPEARDGYFLSTALNPGTVRTGITPQVEQPRFLSANPLDKFHSVVLCNVDHLDDSAIEALEKYVQNGGGLAWFAGELTNSRFTNEKLYREGKGLFPVPLDQPQELLVNRLEKGTDLEVEDHPVFRIFAGERNSFLTEVTIHRYYAVPESWSPDPQSTVRILARLRNGAPLAIEHGVGKGRVLAFLTTASPTWNNWGQNPSYVVAMHELQSYLATSSPSAPARTVATPLLVRLDAGKYQPQVRFLAPGDGQSGGTLTDASPVEGGLETEFTDTDGSGFYQVRLTAQDGETETRLFAFNVIPVEGDLKAFQGEQLATRLKGVQFQYAQADQYQFDSASEAGSKITEMLLYAMIALLLGEQVLAYSASYHPPATKGAVA